PSATPPKSPPSRSWTLRAGKTWSTRWPTMAPTPRTPNSIPFPSTWRPLSRPNRPPVIPHSAALKRGGIFLPTRIQGKDQMKLLPYGAKGQEKPGLLDKDGQIRDLSGVVKDIDGKVLADLSAIRAAKIESLPVVDKSVRIAEPVAKVGKFLCIGLNY